MTPVMDFSQIEDLQPVPPGDYEVEVTKATYGMSKNENPKIDIELTILNGAQEGRIVFDSLVYNANAMPFTKKKLIGIGYDSAARLEFDAGLAEDLIGRTCRISVKMQKSRQIDPDTGEPYPDRPRVNAYYPLRTSLKDLLA